MISNYTLRDLVGIVEVLPVFGLVLFVPGYLLGTLFDLFSFRARGFAERILLSIVLSCSISPCIINVSCRFFSVQTVSIVTLICGFIFLIVLLFQWRSIGWKVSIRLDWTTKASFTLGLLWLAICLISFPDLQLGERLYSTSATFDHAVRSAFIASALRTGAPPANPFFFPGHAIRSSYYYYWNVLCAVPAYITRAEPRIVLYASCFWSGLCLASLIPIYLKHFLKRNINLRLTTLFGFALLGITGLDLIPSLLILLFPHVKPYADMEWWDPVQITSWLDSLLWVPHHVAALVACLTAFLLSWHAVAAKRKTNRIPFIVLSAIGFSSAAGLSVYVTLTFAGFMVAWVAYLLISRRFATAAIYIGSGLLAVAISVGYLTDLLARNTDHGAVTTSLVSFTLRQLPGLFSPFVDVLGQHNKLLGLLLHWAFIFLTLFLELGIYFAVGVMQWKSDWKRRAHLSEEQKCLWCMVLVTLTVITLFRSTVIESNDLAWRGSMILQFALLLWTAIYLADRVTQNPALFQWKRLNLSVALSTMLLIGAMSSLYQLFFLRTFNILHDRNNWHSELGMSSGADAFAIRKAYDALNKMASPNSVVQFNPQSKTNLQFLIDSRYQQADAIYPDCGVAFGGSLAQCHALAAQLTRIYAPDPSEHLTKDDVLDLCRSMKIDWLIVDAQDPIWTRTDSWIVNSAPAIDNQFVRIYHCSADH